MQIIKSDESSGKRISGVRFEVRKVNGEIVGTYTTDSDGVIYLPEIESGWYTVTELKAAPGYLLDTASHRIEVKDGQTATLEITNHPKPPGCANGRSANRFAVVSALPAR